MRSWLPMPRLKQTKLSGRLAASNSTASPSKPRKLKGPISPLVESDVSDVGAIKLEPQKPDDDDDTPSPTKRKRKRRNVVDSDAEGSEIQPVKRKTRSSAKEPKGKEKAEPREKKKPKVSVKPNQKAKRLESESERERSPQPRRRKLVKGSRPAPRSDTESDEVEPERIIENRFRSRDKKTEFQKNLERLKRKKQGKPMSSEDEDKEEEEEEDDDDTAQPFKGAAPASERDSLFDGSDESDGSESFIVEDGGAGVATLPTQFSMDTHQDLSYHFKTIFQFFVHTAVHPPAERHIFMEQQMKNEEYFSVPLIAARRKITGLRDSLVASSVWRPDYKGSLEKYPEFDLTQLDFGVPGQPYDRLGYEDLDDDQDSGDEDEESVNQNSSRPEYHLGRFCARRTRVYHDLTHWEHMLFKTIRDEVDDLHISEQEKGAGRFVRVAWVGGLKPPKDLHDADGICDWLDQRKIIEQEWEKLKGLMERARTLELDGKKGDGVDVN
ncbi:hypothetical protein D9757_001860 [Collybiopsis confluens]|uniref:DUF4211 domain-containing protein n=1 Tax=Collybiopsis confluens TaxID=2823264 RepID=A0A8H5HXF5_9AGAR|nr:hypothetical protein D9757_001860 [Collybiopsis confluens]